MTTQQGSQLPPQALLQLENLKTHFPGGSKLLNGEASTIRAVDGVTMSIAKGETMGLVGESGCGKSTLGRSIVRLHRPTGGRILYEGKDLASISGKQLRTLRRDVQMVFQDPFSSLDPRMRIGDTLAEPLRVHRMAKGAARSKRVGELLALVGMRAASANRYPHEFSGGQRQRIGIARALAVNPTFLICDEPVSALDASVQAQILNLIEDLRNELGLTCLFIAHDLSVVRHVCSHVSVMYLGKVAEIATRDALFSEALHPYTKALLSAVPVPNPTLERQRQRVILTGDVPSAAHPPTGCRFHTRCPIAVDRCRTEEPALEEKRPGHVVACHLVERVSSLPTPTLATTP